MLGENIREARKRKGFTMKELGAKIGAAESTISFYEKNKREPDYNTLKKIADVLDTSISYLFGEGLFNQMDVIIKYRNAVTESVLDVMNTYLSVEFPGFKEKLNEASDIQFVSALSTIISRVEYDQAANELHIHYWMPDTDGTKNQANSIEIEHKQKLDNKSNYIDLSIYPHEAVAEINSYMKYIDHKYGINEEGEEK